MINKGRLLSGNPLVRTPLGSASGIGSKLGQIMRSKKPGQMKKTNPIISKMKARVPTSKPGDLKGIGGAPGNLSGILKTRVQK